MKVRLLPLLHSPNPTSILKYNTFQSLLTPDLYLSSSIILETACTLCLPNVKQNKLWFIPIYMGYGVSFYLFPKSLDKYSLNLAYTIWCGVGIVFTFIMDLILKRDVITIKKLMGIMVVIQGIQLMK